MSYLSGSERDMQMVSLHPDDFRRLEQKVDRLTDAIQRLIIIEERQSTMGERIGALESKTSVNEDSIYKVDRKVDQWINRGIGVWALMVTLFAVIEFGSKVVGK